jgi:hypothetical protein
MIREALSRFVENKLGQWDSERDTMRQCFEVSETERGREIGIYERGREIEMREMREIETETERH